MCVHTQVFACEHRCPWQSEEGDGSSGIGVTCGSETFNMGTDPLQEQYLFINLEPLFWSQSTLLLRQASNQPVTCQIDWSGWLESELQDSSVFLLQCWAYKQNSWHPTSYVAVGVWEIALGFSCLQSMCFTDPASSSTLLFSLPLSSSFHFLSSTYILLSSLVFPSPIISCHSLLFVTWYPSV